MIGMHRLLELPLLTDAEDAEVNRHEFILDTAQEANVTLSS